MPLSLLAPALLSAAVPELDRQSVRLPNLEALCAAGRVSDVDGSAEQWLCAQLGLHVGAEPPLAALRLAAETLTPMAAGNGYWLCADPIATTLGMDSVRIDRVVTDLSPRETEELTRALSEFFAQDGLRFAAASAARWYVQCNVPQRMATTTLWRVLGGSMLEHLPTGIDAPAWRARLNEAQMLLHAHPVNTAREAHGLPAVASVWWWGGGAWPAFGPAQVDAVVGGPRWIGPACAANHIEFQPVRPDPAAVFRTGTRRTTLIIDDDWEQSATTPDLLARWDGEWFGPLRSALQDGQLDHAALLFPWGDGALRVDLESAPRSHWRRWFGAGRRAVAPPLAATLQAFAR